MRLLIVRHGDPDYVRDSLTEKGEKEAKALARLIQTLQPGTCYQSPLGRAQKTAGYSLEALGCQAQTVDWLREFPAVVDTTKYDELGQAYRNVPVKDGIIQPRKVVWDVLPSYFAAHPEYLDREGWKTSQIAKAGDLTEVYDRVTRGFDEMLASHGYVRDGYYYRVEHANEDTVTLFCHFGITCVLLSHLWNVSPFILWHSCCFLPTSVTEVVTEEREKGLAAFRALRLGDLSHLYLANEPASFSARFCETYDNDGQRH